MRFLAFALAAGFLLGSAGMAAACSYHTASKDQILASQGSQQTPSGPQSRPTQGDKDVKG